MRGLIASRAPRLDPSESMPNFSCRMDVKKTQGLGPVEPIDPSELFPEAIQAMAIYSDVTRSSVLAAIRECDEKGRDPFLREHGYRRARSYFLVVNGREYDSKAILGVACGYEHAGANQLPYDAFSGGRDTVEKHLRSLGFEVRVTNDAQAGRTRRPSVRAH